MNAEAPNLVAKVTKEKSADTDRFQCSAVCQLWGNGQVTIDHCIEDVEWGGIDETREIADPKGLPEGFFKAGFSRLINHAGAVREAPL
jgi:hypothetical protein